MPVTMYRVGNRTLDIVAHEVQRVTASRVYFLPEQAGNTFEPRSWSLANWFETWEQARQFALERAERRHRNAVVALEDAQEILGAVKRLPVSREE